MFRSRTPGIRWLPGRSHFSTDHLQNARTFSLPNRLESQVIGPIFPSNSAFSPPPHVYLTRRSDTIVNIWPDVDNQVVKLRPEHPQLGFRARLLVASQKAALPFLLDQLTQTFDAAVPSAHTECVIYF